MAGGLTISTLNNDTGVLQTQNGMTGIPKAWVNFNGTTSPATIRGSFNVSSVTKTGGGSFTINFSVAMPNINYAIVANAQSPGSSAGNVTLNGIPSSTSSFNIVCYNSNFSATQDSTVACVAVFSS